MDSPEDGIRKNCGEDRETERERRRRRRRREKIAREKDLTTAPSLTAPRRQNRHRPAFVPFERGEKPGLLESRFLRRIFPRGQLGLGRSPAPDRSSIWRTSSDLDRLSQPPPTSHWLDGIDQLQLASFAVVAALRSVSKPESGARRAEAVTGIGLSTSSFNGRQVAVN